MSRRIRIRPAAGDDLDRQARYIAASFGLDAGLRFYHSAEETFRLLLAQPRLGRPALLRNPLLANTRMFPVRHFRQHIIFYRVVRSGIEIVRVVHGARDLEVL